MENGFLTISVVMLVAIISNAVWVGYAISNRDNRILNLERAVSELKGLLKELDVKFDTHVKNYYESRIKGGRS